MIWKRAFWQTFFACLMLLVTVTASKRDNKPGSDLSPLDSSSFIVDNVVIMTEDVMKRFLEHARSDCMNRMASDPRPTNAQRYCNRTWDSISCWPDTPAGQSNFIDCPNYIHFFNVSAKAYRECMADGTWYINPDNNRSWTNYTQCEADFFPKRPQVRDIMAEHLPRIRVISNVGYGMSLVTLIVAVALMSYFRKLHCPRNTLHVNLFISFVLRATIAFIRVNLMVGDIGLPKDIKQTPEGIHFIPAGEHWECKLLITAFVYLISANYMWVFVEGLYLHMLIFMSVFSEKSNVHRYIAFGWLSPLTFVLPWVIVRATVYDYMCWTDMDHHFVWIVQAPITLAMMINSVFFLNIIRVLFTKLRSSNTPEARKYRYRKLAKSTLVLIPLFGVHMMVFVWYIPSSASEVEDKIQLTWLYYDMTFTSFQGFFIALLFCFFNGEVQAEIRKKWKRYKLRRGLLHTSARDRSFLFTTSSTMVSRNRHSIPSDKIDGACGGHRGSTSRSERSSESPPKVKLNGILKIKDNKGTLQIKNDCDVGMLKNGADKTSRGMSLVLEERRSLIDGRQPFRTDCV